MIISYDNDSLIFDMRIMIKMISRYYHSNYHPNINKISNYQFSKKDNILSRYFDKPQYCTLVKETAWLLLLNSRNSGRACWSLRSKDAFLENYLPVSTWILNGSSIECHDKKHQPFSLSGVWFGSRAIQISGGKSAWRWSGRKCAFHLWLLIMCSKSQRKTHQIAQIRHFEPRKFWNGQTV